VPDSVAVGVVFFVYLAVAGVAVGRRRASPRDRRDESRRAQGASHVVAAAAVLILASIVLTRLPPAAWRTHALNWLPGAYLLAGYWLPARLPRRFSPRLERLLAEADRGFFEAGLRHVVARAPRLLLEYLEAAYLCCYVVVPLGLVWLYAAGASGRSDQFWTAVLAAALPCYGLLPWLETRPPRSVEEMRAIASRRLIVRRANLLVLNRASVGANTFPSGHAAASIAAALAIGETGPLAGAVFGAISLSIAAGAVVGRYHYALDTVIGLLAGVLGFLVSVAASPH
jgi:hypothetical protein